MSFLNGLLKSFLGGQIQAGFDLFDYYEKYVRTFLAARVSVPEAEDLLSQIRLAFVRRLPDLKDREQMKPFIFQLTRDELKRHWLQKNRQVALDDTVSDAAGKTTEELYLYKQRLLMLRRCLEEIPNPKVKQVAEMRFREEQPHKTIQDVLNLSVDQVKKCIRRAELSITDCVRRKLKGS